MTVIVSVGRNIAGTNTPLGDDDWFLFRAEVRDYVATFAGPVYFKGTGYGEDSTTGDREESFTVIAEGPTATPGVRSADLARFYLHQALERTARHFKQAAVAVTYGDTVFVETGL